jgi:hypothetical protein
MRVFKFIYYLINTSILDTQIKRVNFKDLISRECYKIEKKQLKRYSAEKILTLEKIINNELIMIDKASLFFPGEAKCLHRAILQYRLLRGKFKLPVKIVIGVKKFPFSSHAWIQWKNSISFCEAEENIIGYSVIFDSDRYIKEISA